MIHNITVTLTTPRAYSNAQCKARVTPFIPSKQGGTHPINTQSHTQYRYHTGPPPSDTHTYAGPPTSPINHPLHRPHCSLSHKPSIWPSSHTHTHTHTHTNTHTHTDTPGLQSFASYLPESHAYTHQNAALI